MRNPSPRLQIKVELERCTRVDTKEILEDDEVYIEIFRVSSGALTPSTPGHTFEVTASADALVDSESVSRAYQIVLLLAGFLMAFHVIGINTSYGVFQEFYTSDRTSIQDARGQNALISFVGTIGTGLTWAGGVFVNPLIAGPANIKLVALVGASLMSLGLILASFSTQLWHLFLTQGLLYGIGASMYYFPILAVTPLYFNRYRGLAMGIVLAGSSLGGLVLSPVQQFLIDHYGAQWTLRIIGLWNLGVSIPVSLVIRQHPKSRKKLWINFSLLKKGTFWFQALGAFLQAGGNVVPIYYIVTYSVSMLSLSPARGSLFLSVHWGVNCFSRVALGLLADYVGRQNTLIAGVFLSTLAVFALWFNAQEPRFIAFVVIYGIFGGGYNALLPTTIVEIYGVENYAGVNGLLLLIRGFGVIFGAPIAGVILGTYERRNIEGDQKGLADKFNMVAVYSGMLLLASALCVLYVRRLDAFEKQRWKWRA